MSNPANIPREGETWEVANECDVHIQYLFSAPITFSGSARLAAGERVRILPANTNPQPAVVSFLPARYEELHDSLVPQDMRETPRYKKYVLSIKAVEFQSHFRWVDGGTKSA
jgi:hypothetical protein